MDVRVQGAVQMTPNWYHFAAGSRGMLIYDIRLRNGETHAAPRDPKGASGSPYGAQWPPNFT